MGRPANARSRLLRHLDLRPLRQRPFLVLLVARSVAAWGGAFGPVALSFGVLSLQGASPRTLSVVLAAQFVPQVGFMLVGGVVADRCPRQAVVVAAQILSACAYGGMAALVLRGGADPVGLMVACALAAGVSSALLLPALSGILPTTVAQDLLQPANSLLRLGLNASRVVGVAMAGTLVATVGAGWALTVDASALLLAATLFAGLRPPHSRPPAHSGPATPAGPPVQVSAGVPPGVPRRSGPSTLPVASGVAVSREEHEPQAGERGTIVRDLRRGWREFAGRQWIWVTVCAVAVGNAAVGGGRNVLGPIAADRWLGGPVAWSLIMGGFTLGTITGSVLTLGIRPSRPILVAMCLMLCDTLPLVALAVHLPVPVIVAAMFLAGVADDVFAVLWETTLQREVPSAVLSRVSAYEWLGSLALVPVGMGLVGPLADAFGVQAVLLGCAAIIAAVTLLGLASPQVRARHQARTGAAEPEI